VARKQHEWGELPTRGFVRGRLATAADVEAGAAAFVVQPAAGQAPRPMPLQIPQYAYYRDPDTGTRVPGILIQAECAGEVRIASMRACDDGRLLAGLLDEFELLGATRPDAGRDGL
jgi:hypothetical protein